MNTEPEQTLTDARELLEELVFLEESLRTSTVTFCRNRLLKLIEQLQRQVEATD